MSTISFLVNSSGANSKKTVAWVTIEEKNDGALFFTIKQVGNVNGDLYGIYLDMTDESILNTLRVSVTPNNAGTIEGSMNCLRNGTDSKNFSLNKMGSKANNRLPKNNKDEISNYSFLLRSKVRELSLCDFFHMQLDYSKDYANSCIVAVDGGSHLRIYLRLV